MNFLVDVNPNMKPIEYNMVLCKLNQEQIMTIKNISNLQYRGEFISIDELSFDIPLYRMEPDGTQVKNERYDAIKGDMLILLNDMKYFYIHYAKEKVDSDGATYKEVQAYSREYELSQKKLVGYSGISRKIYDYTNSKDENGLEIGFFNHIEKICSWRVNYINANVLDKFRALDFPNSNLLQAFQTVQQTFGCVFQFNTLDKTIDIYEVDQLGTNRGLRISDRNFLQTLEKTIKSDEIKTRLYLYGRDNISIQKLSITGQSYIENYDFYKTTEYMSQDLIDALNNYDNYLQTKQGLFDGYLTQLNTKNALMGTKRDEMVALLTELKVIQTNLDVAISSGQPTGTFKSQETTKLAEISTKQTEIDTLQDEIDVIENNINQIAIDTDMTAHFTEAQARELDSFIREETFQDSNYTEDNLDELLVEGKKILNRISQPAIQFSVSVVDFLSVVEAQHEWDKFVLGDKVNLYHKDLNFDYEVRMIGYTHKPDSNDLDLKFSNTNTIDDANLYLRDLLSEFKTTATSVDFSRFKWDKGETANSLISNYISSNLDLTKQQLIKAEGQKPIFDDRGYWGYKVNPDGSIDDKQLRMTNEVIAMTQDNWNNIEVAISPTLGINATLLNGKISNLATINAEQINVGGTDQPLLEYIDDQTDAVTVHQIVLSNENQSILTDSVGKTTIAQTISTNIDVYRGITKVDGTIGTPLLKNSSGATITFGTITPTNPTAIASGNIIWTIPINTTLPTDSGWIEIPLTIETKPYIKKLFWSKAKEGQQGSAGASAKLVTVAPSHSSFISQSTANPIPASSYTPATLTLTPNFQNCEYSKWQYSLDGTTWIDVASGSNGLTITGNVLSITNTSALYTTSQTFLIFKVLSTTGEYDLVTIPRIYDSTTLAQNALKQNFYYNRTKITEAEGIEVYDNLNRKVLQTGSFDSDGNGTKDMYGHVAYHSDGGYSALVRDGFLRKYLHGEATYLNGVYATTIEIPVPNVLIMPNAVRVPLPTYFRGRGTNVKVFLSPIKFLMLATSLNSNNTLRWVTEEAEVFLEYTSNFNTTNPTPYIDILGYIKHRTQKINGSSHDIVTEYGAMTVMIMILGE